MRERTWLSSKKESIPNRITSFPFTREEKHKIFRGMVVGELEAGFLRYSRREALLRYAAQLGIPEFEASLLIAEAQFHAGDIEPINLEAGLSPQTIAQQEARAIPMRLVFALTTAIFVDLLLIYWMFG